MNIKFHRGLYKQGSGHNVGLIIVVQVVEEVTSLILGDIGILWSSKERSLLDGIFGGRFILAALDADSVRYLDFQDLDLMLFNCKVGHFNIKSMEMDSANRLFDVRCKFTLAYFVNIDVIWHRASLMEFANKFVNLVLSVIHHKFVPEASSSKGTSFIFIIIDDFLEIPRECKYISMLLL